MSARLVVCGSAGTHPQAGTACSSLLVTDGEDHLLVDCGNGSLANLLLVADVADLDGLVLTHLHPDHVADVWGLVNARRFHVAPLPPLSAYAPPGALQTLGALVSDVDAFARRLPLTDLVADRGFSVGRLAVTPFAVRHPVPAFGARLHVGGATVAITGDTGWFDGLVELVAGVDLLVAEATWATPDEGPSGVHLTAAQAGDLAARAGVGRLLLTHLGPTHDPERAHARARAAFHGEVLVATDRMELLL